MKYHVEFDIDFKRNPYKGLYIAVEGIDGSGKSEQVERLAEHFRKQGKEVVITSEPRKEGSIFSEMIHKMLLGEIKLSPIALQYLFTADRVENQRLTVIPALESGKVVISHRAFWSVLPYAVSDLEEKTYANTAQFLLAANSLLSQYHQFIVADQTFYLDVPVDLAMERLAGRTDKQPEFYEKEEKLKKHVIGYEWLLKTFPKEFTRIDGKKDISEVTKEIISKLPTR